MSIQNMQALIDGPTTGVSRQAFPYRRLVLTPIVLKKLPRSVGQAALKKALEKSDVVATWNKTTWAKKIEQRKVRASLSDFDRFKVNKLKNKVNKKKEGKKILHLFNSISLFIVASFRSCLCCQGCQEAINKFLFSY